MIWKTLRRTARRARGAVAFLRFDPEAPTSLASHLDAWARRQPNETLLIFEGQRWSYHEFNRRVAHRASVLAAEGIEAGDRVALMMDNRPAFLLNALALNRMGAAPALINTQLTSRALRHAVEAAEVRAAIVGDEHREAWDDAVDLDASYLDVEGGEAAPTPWRDLIALDRARTTSAHPLHRPAGTDTAALIYTSGTTGLPKASRVVHARCEVAGIGFGEVATGVTRGDVYYCCLPLFHASGFLVALGSVLYTGATLSLGRRFSARRFWDEVTDSGATCFIYIGELCRYLLNSPRHPRERAHQVRCVTGNGMRPELWSPFRERFGIKKIHEFYGATEGNVNMVNLTGREGSVGRMPPWPGLDNTLIVRFDPDAQAPLRDTQGRCVPCATDEPGELLGRIDPARVSQRFDGYLDDAASEAKILRDVVEPGDAWFRSGDLLRRDWLGFHYFVDRVGDTFRWKGENVSTHQVADVLQRLDVVDVANVYGVAIAGRDGRAGMAALVLCEGASFDPSALAVYVARDLPSFARPAFVRLVPRAALTATFKLRKNDLQAQGFNPAQITDPLFVRDDRARAYVPLTDDVYQRVLSGAFRL